MEEPARDHLFINYATEDGAFAEWLTLRLTAAGYRVWCDRVKLLGGESYPKDIDHAIKEGTFRFLAVLSHHSVEKGNPLKERTTAATIQQKRGGEFIIPINLDGLRADELPWQISDLTYIPFHPGWAGGLAQLLKKLASINAPTRAEGPAVVSDWLRSQEIVREQPETLWTSTLDILEVPAEVIRLSTTHESLGPRLRGWPAFRENDLCYWVLEMPPTIEPDIAVNRRRFEWAKEQPPSGISLTNVVTVLLRIYLRERCRAKGLLSDDPRGDLYFPTDLLPQNRIAFRLPSGQTTRTAIVGTRTFLISGMREVCHYHIAPRLTASLSKPDRASVFISIGVRITDSAGKPLEPGAAFRRSRTLRSAWWNKKWLRFLQGIASWFADGAAELNLARTEQCRIRITGTLRHQAVPVGFDESQLDLVQDDDAEALVVEDVVDSAEISEPAEEGAADE